MNKKNRKEVIENVLRDLMSLRQNGSLNNHYAIEENIVFFESIKSILGYLNWLITRARQLKRTELLEINNLLPRWDKEMHKELISLEKKRFPGLITPLVNKILKLIYKKKDRFIGVNLGCGGMEVELQIIKKLFYSKHSSQVVLIGIDKLRSIHELAKENLKGMESYIDIYKFENLDSHTLEKILEKEKKRHIIIISKNDIFELQGDFNPKTFDVVYNSLFKHHLTDSQKVQIDNIGLKLAKTVIEYDGY